MEMDLPIETRKWSKIGLFFIAATGSLYCIYYRIKMSSLVNFNNPVFPPVPIGGIATAISVVCFPFVSPAFRKICLPYVPATCQQVKNVIRALNGRSGSLIDLGSGDGRIVSMINDESCDGKCALNAKHRINFSTLLRRWRRMR